MGFFDFFKTAKIEDNKTDNIALDLKHDDTDNTIVENKTNQYDHSNDGSESRLGYGFASSKALNSRGFRDGSSNLSNTGLDNALELLVGEYSSFIQNKIDLTNEQYMANMQWRAKSHGISEAYDNGLEALFVTLEAKKRDFEAELEKISNNTGYIRHIQIAYKNGYSNALEKRDSIEYMPTKK